MNTAVTSRESILKTCRELVSEKGLSALHMRVVAKGCGVALGALYYYFPSKNDLLMAAIESVWEDIFRFQDMPDEEMTFSAYIEEIFHHIQDGIKKYPIIIPAAKQTTDPVLSFQSFFSIKNKKQYNYNII